MSGRATRGRGPRWETLQSEVETYALAATVHEGDDELERLGAVSRHIEQLDSGKGGVIAVERILQRLDRAPALLPFLGRVLLDVGNLAALVVDGGAEQLHRLDVSSNLTRAVVLIEVVQDLLAHHQLMDKLGHSRVQAHHAAILRVRGVAEGEERRHVPPELGTTG